MPYWIVFLIRVQCDYVDTDLLEEVLIAGWNLDARSQGQKPSIAPAEIVELQQFCKQVDLSTIRKQYVDLIHNLRNTGIKISDRRAVKIQNLLAASAVMSNRKEVITSDLWVLKHVWDTEEQIEVLEGIVNSIIEKETNPLAHPQAQYNKTPNAEELIKEIILLTDKWESGSLSFEEQNVVKDKLRYLQTRSNWIKNNEHKLHIQEKIESLWHKMLQTI
jgi:MoxR-like ATPase